VTRRFRRWLWRAGTPARFALVWLIRAYRLALRPLLGGHCRFEPSCSAYAEQAIREVGAVRGSLLAVWRVLRCSPLSAGGVDLPPKPAVYDDDIQTAMGQGTRVVTQERVGVSS